LPTDIALAMRCRAWLRTRFCKNEAKNGLFCHVHRSHVLFTNYIDTLPHRLFPFITRFLTAESRHLLRQCSRTLGAIIPRAPFRETKEYHFFEQFFSRNTVTLRQVLNASHRFKSLPPVIQKQMQVTITSNIETIRGGLPNDLVWLHQPFTKIILHKVRH